MPSGRFRILLRMRPDDDNEDEPGPEQEPSDDAGAVEPEPHLLSRDEILAAPDAESADEGPDAPKGLTVGELSAMLGDIPKLSVFRSSLMDVAAMQDKLRFPGLSHAIDLPAFKPPKIELPQIEPVVRPEIELQRGILEQQRAQNEVLLEMLSETEHTGRQTTWVLRFTFASLLIALFAVGLSIYIGTRESTGSTPAPQPSPSISRSAAP
jgi:hypothetical protein